MILPRINSIIALIFALLFPPCVQGLKSFSLTLCPETNLQGNCLDPYNHSGIDLDPCYFLPKFPTKSLNLIGSEKCMLLYPSELCDRHIFRIFPGIAINNNLTSTKFPFFESLGPCPFPNDSGLLFYKQSDSPAFYNTSAIETYTGCQNLPDFVREEYIEGVRLIGACANLFRDENCTGEVFYVRPINAGKSPPAIAQEKYEKWYDYFTLQSRVASFSPCGANWNTTETGTAVTGITDEPTTEEGSGEVTSLQPSLHSCTPNIFAPMCILLYLQTM